jgi:hypothetical protein
MGSRRIQKNAYQNVEGDGEGSSAEKRIQKTHFGSHPLVDAGHIWQTTHPAVWP